MKLLTRYPISLVLVALLIVGTLGAETTLVHNLAVVFTDDPWHVWLQRVWLSMFIAGPFTDVLAKDLAIALALFAWIFFYAEPKVSRAQMVGLLVLGNFIGSLVPKLLHDLYANLIMVDANHGFSQRDSGISSAALCLGSFVAVRERSLPAMIALVVLLAGLTISDPITIWSHLPPMLIGAGFGLLSKKSKPKRK